MRLAAQRHQRKMNPYSRIPAKITKQTKHKITITKQEMISAKGFTLLCEGSNSIIILITPLTSMAQLSLAKLTLEQDYSGHYCAHYNEGLHCSLSMTMVHTMTCKQNVCPKESVGSGRSNGSSPSFGQKNRTIFESVQPVKMTRREKKTHH